MVIGLDRLLNVALRVVTLGARFFFVIALARFLEPAMVGYYGLFTAAIGFTIYFVGIDFYAYATREVIRTPSDRRGALLKSQAALSIGLYVLVTPVALILLSQMELPVSFAWWFAPILILEYFNQELSRLLVALSQQVTASVVLFLRQGSWAIATLVLFVLVPKWRNLEIVFLLWTAAGLFSAALGAWKVFRLDIRGWELPVDWAWIRRGVMVSLGFLVATSALRGIQTFDRYWIEYLGGIEVVAAYVLFAGIAGSLLAFLDAGVFSFAYPELIRFNHQCDHVNAKTLMRRAFIQTLFAIVAFCAVSWLLMPYLLDWIGNPLYRREIGLFPLVLLATTLNAISMIPHYALYARNLDKPIIISHVAGLGIFLVSTWGLSGYASVFAVLIGLNLAFFLILAVKFVAYRISVAPGNG